MMPFDQWLLQSFEEISPEMGCLRGEMRKHFSRLTCTCNHLQRRIIGCFLVVNPPSSFEQFACIKFLRMQQESNQQGSYLKNFSRQYETPQEGIMDWNKSHPQKRHWHNCSTSCWSQLRSNQNTWGLPLAWWHIDGHLGWGCQCCMTYENDTAGSCIKTKRLRKIVWLKHLFIGLVQWDYLVLGNLNFI